MHKQKYEKYKNEYLNLKKVAKNQDIEYETKQIDWYLFFDLLQVSNDIINLTEPNDIIILVGDTPSYISPFIEKHRKTFHFAFSNKPFGCTFPPYSDFSENSELNSKINLYDVVTPTITNLNAYFDYLNVNTEMTKEFIKNNWDNIVLVDSSSGQSIHGVSIFFNRYVGNIKQKNNIINCDNIVGSRPLQFIQLEGGYYKKTNLNPDVAKKYYPSRWVHNYRPDLIICIGESIFYHISFFMIADAYPRVVPFYSVNRWNISPLDVNNENYDMAISNIKTLKLLLKIYKSVKNNKKSNSEKGDKILKIISKIKPKYNHKNVNQLNDFFDNINLAILRDKWANYFT